MTDRMDIAEFRDFGYLQEANRQFFHPLGLEIIIDDEADQARLGIRDSREAPEGATFGEGEIDLEKTARVQAAWYDKADARIDGLGYIIQPAVDKPK